MPLDFDRYAYVRNSPLVYRDPSGHTAYSDDGLIPFCIGKNCPPSPYIIPPEELQKLRDAQEEDPTLDYSFSIEQGINFLNKLRNHKGWWSEYIDSNDFEKVWKFLLVLVYTFEFYDSINMGDWPVYIGYIFDSFVNKAGELYNQFGLAGLFIYIGSREKFRSRANGSESSWEEGTNEYLASWDFSNRGLKPAGRLFATAQEEMKVIWPLIVSYDGTTYGTGAWDYGVLPDMKDKYKEKDILWESLPFSNGKTHVFVRKP